ncbi:unnamed protein product, partial [marine sediment metagenome]
PVALTVAASRIVGRKATGGIVAMTVTELKTLLALVIGDISINADLDIGVHTLKTDRVEESLEAAGVTIDGVELKDGKIPLSDVNPDVDLAMGAHNITLGAGQTVDGVDISEIGIRRTITEMMVYG